MVVFILHPSIPLGTWSRISKVQNICLVFEKTIAFHFFLLDFNHGGVPTTTTAQHVLVVVVAVAISTSTNVL
jgi:hypothetical protein